ncbi:WUSCHEL-related homeobox 8 [Acorus calamus]|uniref:WUSCHEL-related homeobox 8 n=1 Tax=Acorus calamus TaxID=4465 RepID=A0AAV9EDF7_ACOCL|nr:WUSCHEL-related homeobox 8 [Acorus calamus]
MVWLEIDEREKSSNNGFGGSVVNGGLVYPVMTEQQIEILRHQIVAYTIICDQLVEMYNSFIAQQDFLGLGHCDPLMASRAHKISSRQRWAPTHAQLHILENLFVQGSGTPTKQKIKEITNELAQHGLVIESNVYNWFQNRRARSKKKKRSASQQSNTKSEADTLEEKKGQVVLSE